MQKNYRKRKGDFSVIFYGTLLSILLSLGLAMLCAVLVESEVLNENSIAITGMFSVAIGQYLGTMMSHLFVGCKKGYTCLIIAAAYLLCLLLIGHICYGGAVHGFGASLFIVTVCGFLSILSLRDRGSMRSKYRYKLNQIARKQ